MKTASKLFLAFILPLSVQALEFGAPFSDRMVLQCDKPIPVWGKAEPGTGLTITLGVNVRKCIADAQGKWNISFPAREASFEPIMLKVGNGESRRVCVDVLVGEVWYCSGQSNMGRRLNATADAETYAAQANLPHVRYAEVPLTAKDEPQDDVETAWQVWTPDSVMRLSGTAFHFGKKLAEEIDKPIGIISCSWGGSKIQAWIPREYFSKDPAYEAGNKRLKETDSRYTEALKHWKENGSQANKPKPNGCDNKSRPGLLDNGMAHPIQPYAIRGIIWYQGESDTGIYEEYRSLFKSLVASWRNRWNDPSLPVYYVQLPNFRKPPPLWAPFRQMQLELLEEIPNSGMAITIDIGDPNDIHPANKYDVGQRLGCLALHHTYGRKEICPSGPLPEKAVRSGNCILLTWEWACEGLKTSDGKETVLGFALANSDGKFQPSEARIVGNDTVKISHPYIGNPARLRYAYEADPNVNLVNSENLPASPCELEVGDEPNEGNVVIKGEK